MLKEIIIEKIKRDGPISFHDFMEVCLYYPDLGYYTSPKIKLGKGGDYYTSSYVAPVFGAMIAKQLEEMWEMLGRKKFKIIEYGAGTGLLAHDILQHLKNNSRFYELIEYCIIEKSPAMRDLERAILVEKVSWYDSIDKIPGKISGCVLSNELLDNFSVHQVLMQERLMEIFVDYDKDFLELIKPADPKLEMYLEEFGINLPRGFRTEINLEAISWIKDISDHLNEGWVLTIDYGYPSTQLYAPCRKNGTVMCYYDHLVHDNPYKNIGEQDITAHVNFSALYHAGKKFGLAGCGLSDQSDFLVNLGMEKYVAEMKEQAIITSAQENLLRNILLDDLGTKLKVLIQRKGVPKQELHGLQKLQASGAKY